MPGSFCSSDTSAVLMLIRPPEPGSACALPAAFTVSAAATPDDLARADSDPDTGKPDPSATFAVAADDDPADRTGFCSPAGMDNVSPAALVPG